MINIYADESCHTAHRYLVLGGIAVDESDRELAILKFKDVRYKHNTWGEVKWEKISKAKLPFYLDYAKIFFELNSVDILHFHALCVDTQQFIKGQDAEIGFNKLIYQLLLHKFGRKYGKDNRLHVYLDKRTTSQPPDFMRPILNAGIRKKYGLTDNPFRRITFIESNRSELIQMNDLLIGAIGSRKNEHHLKQDASKHKIAMGEYISRRSKETVTFPFQITSRFATRFSLWIFKYRKKS